MTVWGRDYSFIHLINFVNIALTTQKNAINSAECKNNQQMKKRVAIVLPLKLIVKFQSIIRKFKFISQKKCKL